MGRSGLGASQRLTAHRRDAATARRLEGAQVDARTHPQTCPSPRTKLNFSERRDLHFTTLRSITLSNDDTLRWRSRCQLRVGLPEKVTIAV